MRNYRSVISKFPKQSILVIGDLILDQYIRGSVSRISPEAPVPVVLQQDSFYTPGGAANVAHNLSGLGAQVTLMGIIGKDDEGQILLKDLKKRKIDTKGILVDAHRPTVTKTRVIAQHQQVVRIDKEDLDRPLAAGAIKKLHGFLDRHLKEYDAVILSDYGKGLLTAQTVQHAVTLARQHKVIITVDPKVEHFDYYRRVTAITPNLKETENAIRSIKITSPELSQKLGVNSDKLRTDEEIDCAGRELLKCLELESLLVTLSERGMRLFEKGRRPVSIKTKAIDVFDVTGAGDAVISVFTLALACGASKPLAADLANVGAGVVVGKLGAVAVTKKELLEALREGEK
ncbi:MAG: D-glycero-beta-D-manno-heptose-7-phosphate kinase [Candidatus Omnitrophica bacterium]|nr:D-glycero-beta-D-manno-heptose-7-phosphate kinase [Candidatus Omnitrophota bacterium]MCB9721285.1 D-glycero-beta-D-manno-heptose-7-phosphate kinase [Candidatus Omnitrophota bacterium]